jgi:muramidase (phage lysozyme)
MRTIFDNMQKFGYGIEQLGEMTALLKANSKELAAFGGTAASGTKAFADAAADIQRSNIGKSLQMLGKTPDDINKGIAGFVRQQQLAGVSSSNIQKDLAQRSAEYVKQLDLMSKLTGESAEALQANREASMAESAFNQTIYELQKKGDKESLERAAELQKASDLLAKTPALQKEFWQGVGGDVSAMGKTLMISADAAQYTQAANFKAATFVDKFAKGADEARGRMGELYKLNALDDVLGSAKELSIVQSRYADSTAKSQEDRAKAEQELQKTGLEPGTKAQVEMRIEQMKTRDSLQSLINKGINPVTDAMKHLASGIETVTGKIPGTGTSTGTQMGGPGGPSGGFLSNLFGGGKKVSGQSGALLDLIGKGESGGNYNALVGGGTADLTNMTVAQVQELQKKMLKEGRASSAVGKYQMISSTLAEQMKKAGLDPNTTKFDQGTQDLLAQQLVNQAGYGKKDPATVMKNLAGTWAALPKDMSGRGAYDGYNTNKANINPNELMAAITGPNGGYRSTTSGLNPSGSLPTAASSNAPATSAEPDTPSWLMSLNENLERQNRLQSEAVDALGRIRQNTAVQ